MIALKTILLPADGSECSGKARVYALSFARQYKARVVALHVIDRRWEEQTRLVTGIPFEEIVTTALTLPADLIILGTHGRTGMSHLLLGSVAEKVVRKAPCPVLTVRQEEHDFARL